jgi:hypothetical protein
MPAVVQNRPEPVGDQGYLEMEERWLNLARSYEFAERLSNFTRSAGAARTRNSARRTFRHP